MTTTANYGWTKPTVNGDSNTWGTTLNADLDSIDSTVKTVSNTVTAVSTSLASLSASGAPLASPTFTGDPKAPTPSAGDNDTSIATTAFVTASFAPLASPTFTGDPKAPTPSPGDNDTSIATTAFVAASFAPLASPTFTGDPKAPTPSAGDNDTSVATTAFVTGAVTTATPPGTVITFAANSIPTGWLKCNGAAVSRTTYAALFAAIGATYGAGDGSTTFNLPDLRGQFVRGYDDGRGVDTGRSFGSAQTDAMQGHFHVPLENLTPGSSYGFDVYGGGTGFVTATPGGGGARIQPTTGIPVTDGTNGTPRTAAETRPTNVALLYLIKT